MGRLPVCFYGEEDPNEALKRFYEGVRALSERGIDGHNISANLLGDGLVFDEPTDPRVTPRKIVNELADTTSNCYTRCKTDGLDPATEYGLETFVKASNATYGKWCLGDVDDPDKQQILSLSTDVYTAADPGSTVKANLGHLTLDTLSSSFNIITNDKTIRSTTTNTADIGTSTIGFKELYVRIIDTDGAQSLLLQRNNVTQLTLNGTTVTAAVKVVSTQLESTIAIGTAPLIVASTTVVANLNASLIGGSAVTELAHLNDPNTFSDTNSFGDIRLSNSNQTATNGGSYSVAATVGTVFVDASALTAAQNFTVTLPSAVTYAARIIAVKISVVGAATSTLTVGSSAGNVEGSASQAWDTSVRSGAIFISNGTDWYYSATYGLA